MLELASEGPVALVLVPAVKALVLVLKEKVVAVGSVSSMVAVLAQPG